MEQSSTPIPVRRRPAPSLGKPVDEVVAAIQRRSRSLHARGRVAEALYSLALDIVGESDLSEEDRAWLLRTLTRPVAEASQAAIDALVAELALAMRAAPPRIRPAIVTSPISRIDFE
ncbi:MAG: hypothetical protein M3N29_06395 [Chloroflexota bacterium]|nr:hypothetical protein [Chloroflexota bacterium]